MTTNETTSASYEAQHVHNVYEEIASHFSSTRYKPWPIVERFLKEQPDGAVGADVGCGNGKYLGVNSRVFIVASDRSTNLVKIARQNHPHPHSTLVADTLSLPHPSGTFDFAISIAVVHHLSTPARRVQAIRCILDVLRPLACSSVSPSSSSASKEEEQMDQGNDGGKALIYVWALEQKDSRRGWDEGHEQDVMVPWVVKGSKGKKEGGRRKNAGGEEGEEKEKKDEQGDKTYLRYYHLYRKGELERDVEEAGGVVVESGYEKDNWWAIARRK